MAEARTRDGWAHTSTVMALLANCHRDPKKTKPYRPADFDPFAKAAAPCAIGFDVLRDVFVGQSKPKSGKG